MTTNMTINDDNKTVTLPIEEYNRMVGVIKNKKDIHVSFIISQDFGLLNKAICNVNRVYEMNDEKLDEKLLVQMCDTINDIISWQKEETNKYKQMVKESDNKLFCIESKWWYKLFKNF